MRQTLCKKTNASFFDEDRKNNTWKKHHQAESAASWTGPKPLQILHEFGLTGRSVLWFLCRGFFHTRKIGYDFMVIYVFHCIPKMYLRILIDSSCVWSKMIKWSKQAPISFEGNDSHNSQACRSLNTKSPWFFPDSQTQTNPKSPASWLVGFPPPTAATAKKKIEGAFWANRTGLNRGVSWVTLHFLDKLVVGLHPFEKKYSSNWIIWISSQGLIKKKKLQFHHPTKAAR